MLKIIETDKYAIHEVYYREYIDGKLELTRHIVEVIKFITVSFVRVEESFPDLVRRHPMKKAYKNSQYMVAIKDIKDKEGNIVVEEGEVFQTALYGEIIVPVGEREKDAYVYTSLEWEKVTQQDAKGNKIYTCIEESIKDMYG